MPGKGRGRILRSDYTLRQIIQISDKAYKNQVDDKQKRQIDIVSAKIVGRERLKYNFSTRKWEQFGRSGKIIFTCKTSPITYKRPKWDVKPHNYPVYFLFQNFEMGVDSPFRYRSGSFKKWIFPKKIPNNASKTMKQKIHKENAKKAQKNLDNGKDGWFFFHLEAVLAYNRLLYGPNTTNGMPKETNPKWIPYLDKHSLWIVKNILISTFFREVTIAMNTKYENKNRDDNLF